jgi:hypothetical protein
MASTSNDLDRAAAAVRANPQDPEAWVALGASMAEAGDRNKARDCYEQALRLKPDHVIAQAALAQSEPSLPIQPVESQAMSPPPGNPPWNPIYFVGLAFLFTFAASGILAGLNWRRLGKPRRMWPTILLSVVGLAALLAGVFTAITLLLASGRLVLSVGYLIINIGLGALLTYLQQPAFNDWVATYGKPTRKASGCLIPTAIAFGTFTVLCLCAMGTLVVYWRIFTGGPGPEDSVITDPAEVAHIAESMADYDLPPGYHEESVVFHPLFETLVFAPRSIPSGEQVRLVFSLLQWTSGDALPDVVVREVLRRFYLDINIIEEQNLGSFSLRLVGEVETVIARQNVTLTTYEGADDEGNEIRYVVSSWFELRNVPTLVFVLGSVEDWDQSIVDAFIESIR